MTSNARKRQGLALLAWLVILGGCPKRFDPRADTVGSSPNREADHAYHEAKARLDIGDHKDAEARFASFLEHYPNDPLAPSARLGRARALLMLNQGKKAEGELEPMTAASPADPTAQRARYLLGLALHQTHDYARSRELLRPFVAEMPAGDNLTELHAVLGDDAAQLGDAEDALREYGLFFAGARPVEKLYLRDQVSAIVDKLSSLDAYRIWTQSPKDGLTAAYLGRRLAAERRAAGDEGGAKQLLEESRGARERVGLEEAKVASPSAPAPAGAQAIGCLLPLSGKGRALGERGLRGALLAADLSGVPASSGVAIELRVRDTGSDPARAAAALEELAKDGVVAVVGSPDRVESQMAAPKAEALGVPFLELAPDDVRRGALTFKLVRPRSAGATQLARLAVKSGAKTVAVLAPDSVYGRAMAAAFVEGAKAAGARVVADLRYAEGSTTFIDPVKKLQAAQPDALFVPAAAAQLALIAPQLASTGVVRMPNVKASGKAAQLYATADGMNASFLASTAKYLQGAVLAPVFYPDLSEARVATFVERYRAAFGEEPSSLDALAYDAVRATRIALEQAEGAGSEVRQSVALSLAHLGENGLTGVLAFSPSGDRVGAMPLYLVGGDEVNLLK